MVFGIGEGKVNLQLNKTQFSQGETISGNIQLELKKPKQAKRMFIEFYGEQKQRTRTGGIAMGIGRSTRPSKTRTDTVRIFEFSQDLDIEKEYAGNETYSFEIKIPTDLLARRPEGAVGTMMDVAKMLGGIYAPKWYVRAALDVTGLDIAKRIQINIV